VRPRWLEGGSELRPGADQQLFPTRGVQSDIIAAQQSMLRCNLRVPMTSLPKKQRHRGIDSLARNAAGDAHLGPLSEIRNFGSNPGRLRMFLRIPTRLSARPALIVALHGCKQTASSFDLGSGWSVLAERHGFLALFPEQQVSNNPNRCFNWFSREDTRRDGGEARSIRNMIDHVVEAQDIDTARIFVTGLSAGGAMASSLLAAFPELFNAGAILAGLPHGSAANVGEAMLAMSRGRKRTSKQWGEIVRTASTHDGPWPRLSIWHGGLDGVVHPANADASVLQWTNLHDVRLHPSRDEVVGNHRIQTWSDGSGRDMIVSHTIEGMGHGVPVASAGEHGCGIAGPFHFDVGISSSARILEFFGLSDAPRVSGKKRAGKKATKARQSRKEGAPSQQGSSGTRRERIVDLLQKAGVLNKTATGSRRRPPLTAEEQRFIAATIAEQAGE